MHKAAQKLSHCKGALASLFTVLDEVTREKVQFTCSDWYALMEIIVKSYSVHKNAVLEVLEIIKFGKGMMTPIQLVAFDRYAMKIVIEEIECNAKFKNSPMQVRVDDEKQKRVLFKICPLSEDINVSR